MHHAVAHASMDKAFRYARSRWIFRRHVARNFAQFLHHLFRPWSLCLSRQSAHMNAMSSKSTMSGRKRTNGRKSANELRNGRRVMFEARKGDHQMLSDTHGGLDTMSNYRRDDKEFRASVARMRAALDDARTVDLRPYGRQESDFDNTLAEQTERPALRKRSKWAAFITWLKGE